MKKSLIILSITVVTILAAMDAKDRMDELDRLAIKTPAQVEMNRDMLDASRQRTRNFTNQTQENATKRENTLYNKKIRKYNLDTNNPLEKQKNKR